MKAALTSILPGSAGVFVTCNRNHERQCTQELIELFNEEAEKQYDLTAASDDDDGDDVEASLAKELDALKQKKTGSLFTPVALQCECGMLLAGTLTAVLFFRTRKPVVPTQFVHKICADALASGAKTTRHTLRLSPVTLTATANEEELVKLAQTVLAPHFHGEGVAPLKYAIRPTIRNHTTMSRDRVIKLVADEVGAPHTVDLANYDRLILIEIFKSVVGLSVVEDYEQFKRYNLQQIFESRAGGDSKAAASESGAAPSGAAAADRVS
ncbi:uncharacterized protein V1510DRAFT_442473 [Dipodascopsis tothii]|uniref:uncharacterized protein n=1 Tax=Dipodascopsis tothii TaxID=44089 RepID=UPI0034CFBA2A